MKGSGGRYCMLHFVLFSQGKVRKKSGKSQEKVREFCTLVSVATMNNNYNNKEQK